MQRRGVEPMTTKEFKKMMYLKKFQNHVYTQFKNYLNDLLGELRNQPCLDSKGNDVTKYCEQMIIQSFIQTGNNLEQNYLRLQGFIELMMVWVKMIMEGSALLTNSPLMQLVLRINSLRWGISTNLLVWLGFGVNKYTEFV